MQLLPFVEVFEKKFEIVDGGRVQRRVPVRSRTARQRHLQPCEWFGFGQNVRPRQLIGSSIRAVEAEAFDRGGTMGARVQSRRGGVRGGKVVLKVVWF